MFSLRGPHGNVFRFVIPFTTTEAQIDGAAEILERALGEAGAT